MKKNTKPNYNWVKLENASKIFPAVADARDPKVFRLSCQLKYDVDEACLKEALEKTLPSFPIYSSVLKKGLFWFYFENHDFKAQVHEDNMSVHSPLYIDNHSKLYRVVYHKKRISLEVFHSLTDGVGASWFLETLVSNYLLVKYKEELPLKDNFAFKTATKEEKMDNAFESNYREKLSKNQAMTAPLKKTNEKIVKIKGKRTFEYRTNIIEANMSVESIKQLSKKYSGTITTYLMAEMIMAIHKVTPAKDRNRPIVITVPVNLRTFFDSKTSRNFFATMEVSYRFEKEDENKDSLESVVSSLNEQFKEKLSENKVTELLDRYISLEKNLITRSIPLFLKKPVMKIALMLSYGKITSSFSNLGPIKTHDIFEPYIDYFTVSSSSSMPQITMVSFNDVLSISFTSPYEETELQGLFIRSLTEKGVEISINY